MIPTTKKEWKEWWIVEIAKQLAWEDLDDDEQMVYINTIKKNIPKKAFDSIDDNMPFVQVSAMRIVWEELSKKEKKPYRQKAQKHLSKRTTCYY